MSVEMFGKVPQEIYETVGVYIFIIGLIITLLYAIVTVIRYLGTTLGDTVINLLGGFGLTVFITLFWPLAIVAVLFVCLGAIIYYPVRRLRKFFWV